MGKKLRAYSTRLTLLAVAIFTLVSIFTPLQSYAAAKQMNPKEEADSWIRYKALEKCFADARKVEGYTLDEISKHQWFTDQSVAVGYLNSGSGTSTGSANCNDTNLVSNAVSYWGFGSAVSAWCTTMRFAGPYRDGANRDCVSGDGNFKTGGAGNDIVDPSTSFKRAVEADFYQVGGGGESAVWNSVSPQSKYWLYYQSFVNLCNAKPVVKLSDADDTQKAIINDSKGYQIRFVNSSNVVEDWIYKGDGDQTKTDRVGIFEDEGAGGFPSCGQLSQWLGDNADQFAQYAARFNYGAPTAPNPVETGGGDGADNETKSTCGIKGGMGWVVCPVMQFLSDMVDTMYSFIQDQLEVPIKMFDMSSGTYTAWSVFRDYANIAFIIAFLFIVYSQVTSVGISNYGIKKMLPKLIIGAILVNTSFFISQFAVDLTNLLGRSIDQLFSGIANAISSGGGEIIGASGPDGGGKFSTVIAGVLIGGVALVVALALGLIGPILLAIALVFLILLLRKVLIIVLIAISPLAFVAYLLPNTEKWFKKWSDMFIKVLMVFPVVAIVVGASKVASAIISQQTGTATSTLAGESSNVVNSLIAAAVLTVPFFVIPGLLSKSLEAMGSFGKKLSSASQRANSKIGKKASSNAKEKWQNSSYMQGKKLRDAGKAQYKKRKFAERVSGEGGLRGWGTRRLARGGAGLSPAGLRTNGAAAGLTTLAAQAEAQADEGFEKDVRAAGLQYATQSSGDIMKELVDSNGNINQSLSAAQRSAAIDRVMASGSFAERRQLVEAANEKMSEGEKARVSKGVYAKGDQNIYGSGIGAKIQSSAGVGGADNLRKITQQNIREGHVNAEHLVQGEGSAEYMVDVANGETTQLDAAGKEMKDATGNKIKVAHARVTGHVDAINQLRAARTQAQANTSTRAKAAGGAMNHTLSRF